MPQTKRMNRVGRSRTTGVGKSGRRKISSRKIASRKTARQKIGSIKASAESWGDGGVANRARLRLWRKTNKQRITMYLDADVLAWFKEKPKYQREINRALRKIMQKGGDME